jgi:hypothetical protein
MTFPAFTASPPVASPARSPRCLLSLWLSLMLILCGVFIVLKSAGVPQPDRSGRAIASVAKAFGGETGWAGATEAERRAAAEVIEALAFDLAVYAPQQAYLSTAAPGLTLRIRLPSEALFEVTSGLVGRQASRLFDRLAAAAAALPPAYRLGVVARVITAGDKVADWETAAARAAVLADALISHGIPPDGLILGVEASDSGGVAFTVFVLPSG